MTEYLESEGVKDVIGVKLIGANSQIVDSATLAEQQAQTALLDLIKQNTTGLVKNDKEIPFVWFLVKQAFTDVTVDDLVVAYAIINTETGAGTPYTKRWRGFIDVTVPSPITDYLVPTGGMPLTLAQFQSVFGNTSDSAATSDTGTFTFISLFKRSLEKLTALLANFIPLTSDNPYSVAGSATSVTLVNANANRRSLTIFNNSTAILYVTFGPTATQAGAKFSMQPGGFYEMPAHKMYLGVISGIWTAANGNASIYEGV